MGPLCHGQTRSNARIWLIGNKRLFEDYGMYPNAWSVFMEIWYSFHIISWLYCNTRKKLRGMV